MSATTHTLLTESLPALTLATPDTAQVLFDDFQQQVNEAVCAPGAVVSRFDWAEAKRIMDTNNDRLQDPGRREKVAMCAARTAVMYQGREVPMHEPNGVFLTTDGQGRPIAGANWISPYVSEEYGSPDPYALLKLGGAIVVEQVTRQGADWGAGYRLWSRLRDKDQPTIGMATLHDTPYGAHNVGEDRRALAFTGSTHRVMTPSFREIVQSDAHYEGLPTPLDPADFLAGLLDTCSSTVANRAAVLPGLRPWVIPAINPKVDFPGVNLN